MGGFSQVTRIKEIVVHVLTAVKQVPRGVKAEKQLWLRVRAEQAGSCTLLSYLVWTGALFQS